MEGKTKCVYCLQSIPNQFITKDHFIPRSKGGQWGKNVIKACRTCNMIKADYVFNSVDEAKDFIFKRRNQLDLHLEPKANLEKDNNKHIGQEYFWRSKIGWITKGQAKFRSKELIQGILDESSV